MTRRNTGGFLSAKEQATDSNSANGIFTLSEAAALTTGGNFPTGGFSPTNSLRFRSSATAFLTRTFPTAGNRQIFTESVWFKRGILGNSSWIGLTTQTPGVNYVGLFLNTDDTVIAYIHYNGSTWTGQLTTTQVFRDPAAWYHIVLAVDTTQTVASSRMKMYVNGTQVTSFSTASYAPQNTSTLFNAAAQHGIGYQTNGSNYFDGYLSEMNWIDGQQLTPSSFGQTDPATGVWIPKRYTGTYGTNGFYLPFNRTDVTFNMDYLVAAGGGGGGSASVSGTAGGGGAGGLITGTSTSISTGTYRVIVGSGGAAAANGSNSAFASTVTVGGGAGGSFNTTPGQTGGSGGGGAAGGGITTNANAGAGTAGQGNAGGAGSTSNAPAGGGGGAGAAGTAGTISNAGSGGNGSVSTIITTSEATAAAVGQVVSTSVYFAGGSAGGAAGAAAGTGGLGGGVIAQTSAAAKTGAGGGGANAGGTGGTGGSGVVIIKIPDTRTATFSSGVTFSGGTASGGFKTYIVTATSTTSETVTLV